MTVEEVYTQYGPGVVSVDVASDRGPGGGSGFVLDENGHIVTNQHVVEGANAVSVRFSSGDRFDAEVVGEDPSTDTAVLEIDAPEELLEPLTLGDSDAVSVGEPVIAIGNPLNVGTSVTTGIVSGTGRPIKAPNNYTINGAVQTDAAINPGSSGGPLMDSRGNVIGVNSQIKSDTGSFQGVGFAVPANVVEGVVRQLITTGEVAHGYIGVRMEPVSVEELSVYSGVTPEELAEEYGLPENGAIVSEVVEGGPAAEAGIRGAEGRPEIRGSRRSADSYRRRHYKGRGGAGVVLKRRYKGREYYKAWQEDKPYRGNTGREGPAGGSEARRPAGENVTPPHVAGKGRRKS